MSESANGHPVLPPDQAAETAPLITSRKKKKKIQLKILFGIALFLKIRQMQKPGHSPGSD
jgi:hypothetical protein